MISTMNFKHELTKKVFESLNLTQAQIVELEKPKQEVLKGKAIEDLSNFFKQSKKMLVCGDFDCDGICSTSIALLISKKLNLEAAHYIPNRIKEGYGVSKNTIQMAFDKGYQDILIIDNGAKSHEEVLFAKRLGLNVAIIDHHLIEGEAPQCPILHPNFLSDYGHSMCAAGLIYSLAESMGLDDDYILSLACLATIADVMPLWGKNRELVKRGLIALNQNHFQQIDALAKRTRYTKYDAKLLAFQVVPKINSVGRMADLANVNTIVQYFTSNDVNQIQNYAQQILDLNIKRKDTGKALFEKAKNKINNDPIQIIVGDDFHEGLMGIVANQVMNLTNKPSIVLSDNGEIFKGSARSSSVSLAQLFNSLDERYFSSFGGHDFAFGMSIHSEFLDDFISDANKWVSSQGTQVIGDKYIEIDESLITREALKELDQFEPFGEGIKRPDFKIKMPNDHELSIINGHGFKFKFNKSQLDEAVLFTDRYTAADLKSIKTITGQVSLSSFNKLNLLIEDFS